MPSFVITDEQVKNLSIQGPSWTSKVDVKTRHRIKLNRRDFQPQSVHHLVHCLITGRDVFKHFNPKNKEQWTMAVLKQDASILHPYHALRNACLEFLRCVPNYEGKPSTMSWQRAAEYIKKMDSIIVGFHTPYRYRLRHDVLVGLREHVHRLFVSLSTRF